jgi:polyferredoxin
LADDGSLVVAYQVELGEPRKGTGACISCEKCVAVCPQGIDIREGFQLECITCARCVDACQGVMEKQGHPESLIVYKPLVKRPALRPRTFAYGSLLTALAVALVVLVVKREPLDATVARAPGSLYTIDADGWVRNTFFLRLSNNSLDPIDVSIASNMSGAEVLVPPVHLEPTESGMAPVVVRLPPAAVRERTLPLEFVVSTGETRLEIETTFKTGG